MATKGGHILWYKKAIQPASAPELRSNFTEEKIDLQFI